MEPLSKALTQEVDIEDGFTSEGSYLSNSNSEEEFPEPGEVQNKLPYHQKYSARLQVKEAMKQPDEELNLGRSNNIPHMQINEHIASEPGKLDFSHAGSVKQSRSSAEHYDSTPSEVDFGVLEGLLQGAIGQRTMCDDADLNQASTHMGSKLSIVEGLTQKHRNNPQEGHGHWPTETPQLTSQTKEQPVNRTPENNSQAVGQKENKEFVLFSWKDAKEFVTMSWHLANCKVCRDTFETWKKHAIRDHRLKPVVHQLNSVCDKEQKSADMILKGILTQNSSGNKQQHPLEDKNKGSQVQKKENSTTSIVLKHLATELKTKPDEGATSAVGQYHCGLCNLHYKTDTELKLHLHVHAGQRIAFKCQKCDRIFMHQGMLQRHMAIHKEQNTICKICGRKFPTVQKARRHRYTHGKKLAFKCDKCKKTYTSMQSLRIHARTHSGEGMLSCQFCSKKFPSKFSLGSHERIHTGEKPYKCKFCSEHFITHSAMSYHKQIHTGFKYMCQHCGKGYRDKSNLREHERIHTGEKPFKCDHCTEAFTTGALLKYHRQVHTGERYECDICKKRYRSRGILNTHMRSHSDTRPFICRFCGKGFREKATLKTHEKGVHLGVKFTCELCKREFTQRSALKTHEKGVHGMHGHDKSKKTSPTRQRRRPVHPSNNDSSSVGPINDTAKCIPPAAERKGPGFYMETEYDATSVVPITIRQTHVGQSSDSYDQVSAAHASTHPPYPMSSSDFHTMVDSLIQFSKDH